MSSIEDAFSGEKGRGKTVGESVSEGERPRSAIIMYKISYIPGHATRKSFDVAILSNFTDELT